MTKLEIRASLPTEHTLEGFEALFAQPDSQAIAADRASRQVANKAEVEPPQYEELSEHLRQFQHNDGSGLVFGYDKAGIDRMMARLLAIPPATTGASTVLRDDLKFSYNAPEVESYVVKNSACLSNGPANFYAYLSVQAESFDKWEKCVAECADGAKEVVELQFKVGDQEWSGSFRELFRILTNSVGASTVLTDERIADIWADVHVKHETGCRIHFAREIEREVAAQAGQVSVPEGWTIKQDGDVVHIEDSNGRWCVYERDTPAHRLTCEFFEDLLAAAPSPAKESK